MERELFSFDDLPEPDPQLFECPAVTEPVIRQGEAARAVGDAITRCRLAEVGRGEFGVVYKLGCVPAALKAIVPETRRRGMSFVLKTAVYQGSTRTQLRKEECTFFREAAVQAKMAAINIAPQVLAVWSAEDPVSKKQTGYILMEELAGVYRSVYPDGANGSPVKHVTDEVELSVIGILEIAIEHGFIHNDNHGGNIGFTADGRVMLFDLGFTVKKVIPAGMKEYILGYSVLQLLEHMPPEDKYSTKYYDLLYAIRQSRYKFGSCMAYAGRKHASVLADIEASKRPSLQTGKRRRG